MIPQAEVFKLARRLAVSERVIEKDYVLSWLLIGISESVLRSELAFKGGTALKRIYYPDYRFSEDLDFSLRIDLSHNDLVAAFQDLFAPLNRRVNLIFKIARTEETISESTTLIVNYVGPLKGRLESRDLKVDVTRGELLLRPLAERPLLAPYSDYPVGVKLSTYTLEEILTEKLCALLGRTEPRDLYDIYCLFESSNLDFAYLPADFAAKCKHKGRDPRQLERVLEYKTAAFKKLWSSRLAEQVADLPEFNTVLRAVRRHIRNLVPG